MNWEQEYQAKLRTPEQAVAEVVRSGDSIYAGGASVAVTALNALFAAVDSGALSHIRLNMHSFMNPGLKLNDYRFSRDQLDILTFFMNGPDRQACADRNASFMPLQYGMYDRYMAAQKPDVCIVLVSPPDQEGYCNIGPFGFTPTPMSMASRIIGQVSKHVPRVNGTAHRYPISRFDALVEADDTLTIAPASTSTPVEQQIANHILEYVQDGSCIQLGIGGIANAIGYGLKRKQHLGIHTEVLTESIIDLMECGAVDNSQKNFHPGKSTVGFVLGTQRQYDYIDNNPDFLFVPFNEVVNIQTIASIDKLISINAAVSVDLTGQVCAESIGRREYSGTGGQLDFVRGASMSKGGASFIAMPSVAKTKSGPQSRIVLDLAPGSIVTTPRTDVQYVVTEYGCVNLQFCSVPERVRKLISIAHPDYRDELTYQAKEAGLLY
jgi:acyl-CoA hydrolase